MKAGEGRFLITTVERDGRWVATAARRDTGQRFGIDVAAQTEEHARAALERWLAWQGEHEGALEALREAEHAYHRTIARSAFVSATQGPIALERQKESLARVEASRARLEEVRARQPS